jgi:hypothetical protein
MGVGTRLSLDKVVMEVESFEGTRRSLGSFPSSRSMITQSSGSPSEEPVEEVVPQLAEISESMPGTITWTCCQCDGKEGVVARAGTWRGLFKALARGAKER